MTADELAALLREFCPLLPHCQLTEDPAGRAWGLGIGGEEMIIVELQPDRRRIAMSAAVAPLTDSAASILKARLPAFNSSAEESCGLWISLDSTAEAVTQSGDLPVDGLDVDRLKTSIDTFLQELRLWREIFAETERVARRLSFGSRCHRILPDNGNDPTLVPRLAEA